jgi:hypothetical protein
MLVWKREVPLQLVMYLLLLPLSLLLCVLCAGKSTFALQLSARSSRLWVRVNQDTAGKGGKRGTRQQCVAAARAALRAGRNVVVDRWVWTQQETSGVHLQVWISDSHNEGGMRNMLEHNFAYLCAEYITSCPCATPIM